MVVRSMMNMQNMQDHNLRSNGRVTYMHSTTSNLHMSAHISRAQEVQVSDIATPRSESIGPRS
jgi:hypothetical protein